MRGIDTLIRLHRRHLDVKRVYRTNLDAQRTGLERRVLAMQQEMADERKVAAESLEARQTLAAYAERMTHALKALAAEIIEIDIEVDRINEEIAEAFQTLKGYELTRDARLKKIADEEARRDRAELDEIGAVQHSRQETG